MVSDGILKWNYTIPFASATGSIIVPMMYVQQPLSVSASAYYNDRQHQGNPSQILVVAGAAIGSNVPSGDITLFRSPSSWMIKRLGDNVSFKTYIKSRTIATAFNMLVETRITPNLGFISTTPSTGFTATLASWPVTSIANQQTLEFISTAQVLTPTCLSTVNATVTLGCGNLLSVYQSISSNFLYAPGIYNLDWDQQISGALCASVRLIQETFFSQSHSPRFSPSQTINSPCLTLVVVSSSTHPSLSQQHHVSSSVLGDEG